MGALVFGVLFENGRQVIAFLNNSEQGGVSWSPTMGSFKPIDAFSLRGDVVFSAVYSDCVPATDGETVL